MPPKGIQSLLMKPGYAADKAALDARLHRIEGQVGGIRRMVSEDRYCIDVLTQVNSVKAALDKVALLLLRDHVGHCVADAVREGDADAKLHELTAAIGRYLER